VIDVLITQARHVVAVDYALIRRDFRRLEIISYEGRLDSIRSIAGGKVTYDLRWRRFTASFLLINDLRLRFKPVVCGFWLG
jgi:hypothetical protein